MQICLLIYVLHIACDEDVSGAQVPLSWVPNLDVLQLKLAPTYNIHLCWLFEVARTGYTIKLLTLVTGLAAA